jgi:hypothetical protein
MDWTGERGPTGLTKGLVVEARLAHVEGVPSSRVEFLIDVDNIQILVLDA